MSSGLGSKSAAGAAFNSRGRKAVDPRPEDEIEARRADIPLHRDMGLRRTFGARLFRFRLTTASRPWLFDDGPADLTWNSQTSV